MNFDLIFREMELMGYEDVRMSLFNNHVRGVNKRGELHFYTFDEDYKFSRI